jgi:hypothetical protein
MTNRVESTLFKYSMSVKHTQYCLTITLWAYALFSQVGGQISCRGSISAASGVGEIPYVIVVQLAASGPHPARDQARETTCYFVTNYYKLIYFLLFRSI